MGCGSSVALDPDPVPQHILVDALQSIHSHNSTKVSLDSVNAETVEAAENAWLNRFLCAKGGVFPRHVV